MQNPDWYPDIGPSDPDAIGFGRFFNEEMQQVEGRIRYGEDQGMLLFGPAGKGKGTRILIPNLLQNEGKSIVVVDPKCELAAVTAPYRRQLGPVYIINPCGVVAKDFPGYEDLKSCGFNPLRPLKWRSPDFNEKAADLAAALVTRESNNPFFDDAARNLIACTIMAEVITADCQKRSPDIRNVRKILATPSSAGSPGTLPIGIPALAREWIKTGIPGLSTKAGQFTDWNREKSSIVSTALTHTEFLDDIAMVADMTVTPERNGHAFDFSELRRPDGRPVTVFLVLPPEKLVRYAKWLRLMITSGLHGVLRPRAEGEPGTLFLIDEFAALGKFEIISNSWALVRGYSVQMLLVLQSLSQLKQLYSHDGADTFIAQAGVIASFGTNDPATADWLSKRAGDKTATSSGYGMTQQSGGNSHQSAGPNWSLVKVPRLPPDKLYSLPEGHMVIYIDGYLSYIPAYAPAYWEIAECAERARRNPYHATRQ